VTAWPWRGGLEPSGDHPVARVDPDAITGAIPEDLRGSLYRVGPGRCRVGSTKYAHWFDGDGAVFKCAFDADGVVRAGVKLVRTQRLQAQEKAERNRGGRDVGIAVRGAWTQASDGFPFANLGRFPTNPSNTAPLFFENKLFALCEGGAPVEIDADTLDTVAERAFRGNGTLTSPMPMGFSAHAKKDADGTLYTWGLAAPPAFGIRVAKISKSGVAENVVDLPLGATGAVSFEFTLVHDCAMSEKHLVFLVPPWRLKPGMDGKLVKALAGAVSFGHAFSWDENRGAWLVVLRKSDLSVVVARETQRMSAYHFAGARDVPGDAANGGNDTVRVLVGVLRGDRPNLEKRFGDMYSSEWADDGYNALREYSVDLNTGDILSDVAVATPIASLETRTRTSDIKGQLPMEFPVAAPGSFGRKPRFVYTTAFSGSGGGYFDVIQKIELGAETHRTRFLPPGVFPSEVEFVPRKKARVPGSSEEPRGGTDSPRNEEHEEDFGYVLYLEYDARAHVSSVVILDARDIAGPELARVRLPYHVPYSFHGTYVPTCE